jgi:hypothetical protein
MKLQKKKKQILGLNFRVKTSMFYNSPFILGNVYHYHLGSYNPQISRDYKFIMQCLDQVYIYHTEAKNIYNAHVKKTNINIHKDDLRAPSEWSSQMIQHNVDQW